MSSTSPLVGILMGSKSDWDTMEKAARTLQDLGVPFEAHVASAHRTPDKVLAFCETADSRITAHLCNGIKIPGQQKRLESTPRRG